MATPTSSLEFALLGLLKQNPCSGYDLRKLFSTTPMRHFSDSPGSIYPALRRLQNRKWITIAAQEGKGRKRQVFRASPEGRHALVHWLSRPVTRDDVVWGLEEIKLRFAFMDGNVARKRICEFLSELENELKSYVCELEEYASASGLLKTVTTGGMAFENGLDGYRAHLSWARRARNKLSEVSS